jgi:transcription termination factor Rho
MNPEDTMQDIQGPENNKPHHKEHADRSSAESVTKIADLQRMNVDQLNHFARSVGLKNLGALTKSQIVFEIV